MSLAGASFRVQMEKPLCFPESECSEKPWERFLRIQLLSSQVTLSEGGRVGAGTMWPACGSFTDKTVRLYSF